MRDDRCNGSHASTLVMDSANKKKNQIEIMNLTIARIYFCSEFKNHWLVNKVLHDEPGL